MATLMLLKLLIIMTCMLVAGKQPNQAAGKDNRYLKVAYDSTTNTELGRASVTENVARPDVAKAYPDVVNAKDSGYQATMNNLDWSKVKSVDDQIHC